MKVGFVGTGSMGSVLVQAFMKSGALKPEQVILHNRTNSKAQAIAKSYPGMKVNLSLIETTVTCDILFLCVKPLEYRNVLEKIALFLRRDQILISITSPVLIRHLEEAVMCKIAKVIPSLTNYTCSGVTLCMYGKRINEQDQAVIESLLCHISRPVQISEDLVRVSSDISSIGPAFMAYFVEQLVHAAVRATGISEDEAAQLAGEMLLGTGMLLTSGGFTPEQLQERISVPGGITEKALTLIHAQAEGLFDQVIMATHAKYKEDLEKVEDMLLENKR